MAPNSNSQSADTSSNHAQVIAITITDAMSKMVGQFTEALKDTKEFIKASIEEMEDPFAMDSTLRSVQQPAPNQMATSNS